MERRVLLDVWQKVVKDDFIKFGTFPRDSFDTLVGDLLIPDLAFDGFTVVQTAGPAEMTVAPGHLYSSGKVYVNDAPGGTVIDLISRLPVATKRVVAITAFGVDADSDIVARTFLTDADTRKTIARVSSTEHMRWAEIGVVSGAEGPDPQAPLVPSNVCVVAWVILSKTGVESIIRAVENVAPNLRDVSNRLNEFDVWKLVAGTLIETLRSDMNAIASRLAGLAPFTIARQNAHNTAWVKDIMRLPDAYQSYAVDHFLLDHESDTEHPDYLATVKEGVRFPPASIRDAQLGLLNVNDELVINTGNVLLPAWDPVARITNVGAHAEMSIAQYKYQTMEIVQWWMSRQVIEYGWSTEVCTNGLLTVGNDIFLAHYGWLDRSTNMFSRQAWDDPSIYGWYFEGFYDAPTQTLTGGQWPTLISMRIRAIYVTTVTEAYWKQVVNNYNVNGAVVGQTFLNSQDGWLCSVDVYFSRIATTGPVTMLLCKTTLGQPDPKKIIAKSVVQPEDLHVTTAVQSSVSYNPEYLASPTGVLQATTFDFQPTFLGKERYCIMLISPGDHYVWCLKNTNLVSGTFFYSTDGAWFQGDPTLDMAFRANFCKFRSNITRVQLQPLQLENGISDILINSDIIIPDVCSLTYEAQKDGVWRRLDAYGTSGGPEVVLAGTPSMLPFRAVFMGSESVQPALGVAANSRVLTSRCRSDFTHISAVRACPASTVISVDIRLEAWLGAPHHTFTCKLMYGAGYTTIINPQITSSEAPGDDLERAIVYHYTFTAQGSVTSFKLRLDGTTDNVLTVFLVSERFDIETTA